MNNRKIKLALTVGLLNNAQQTNVLQAIKDMMQAFRDEVGSFLGLSQIRNARLNRSHVRETYAIQFENCTVNVDLISNDQTRTQVVQGFQLC